MTLLILVLQSYKRTLNVLYQKILSIAILIKYTTKTLRNQKTSTYAADAIKGLDLIASYIDPFQIQFVGYCTSERRLFKPQWPSAPTSDMCNFDKYYAMYYKQLLSSGLCYDPKFKHLCWPNSACTNRYFNQRFQPFTKL